MLRVVQIAPGRLFHTRTRRESDGESKSGVSYSRQAVTRSFVYRDQTVCSGQAGRDRLSGHKLNSPVHAGIDRGTASTGDIATPRRSRFIGRLEDQYVNSRANIDKYGTVHVHVR